VVIVGVFEAPSSLHFNEVGLAEREVIGSLAYVDDFPRTIALVADKRIQAEPFITGGFGLDEVITGGFGQLITNKDQHVKILVNPSQ